MNSKDPFNDVLISIAKATGSGLKWLFSFLWMANGSKKVKTGSVSYSGEYKELGKLLEKAKLAYKTSKFFEYGEIEELSASVIIKAFTEKEIEPTNENIEPFYRMVCYLRAIVESGVWSS